MSVKRILIIGSPGSGKSSLSNKMHKITGLPLIHLDDEYWLENWSRPEEEDWLSKLQKLVQGEAWIIEGNYFNSFETRLSACDLVIFLDVPWFICLWRAFKRGISRWMGNRDSLPKKVKYNPIKGRLSISLKFIRLILFYKSVKLEMLKLIASSCKELIVFNHKN